MLRYIIKKFCQNVPFYFLYNYETDIPSISASDENVCHKPLAGLFNPSICDGVVCDCPSQPYECPDDSVFIETRIDNCCVKYACTCPDISCPLLMDASKEVMPQPEYRGGRYPGRCCPLYTIEGMPAVIRSSIMRYHYL